MVLREQILAQVQSSMRQGVDLSIGVPFSDRERVSRRELVADGGLLHAQRTARRSRLPQGVWLQRAIKQYAERNGLTCRRRDLDREMPRADPQSLRTIQQYLDVAAQRQPTQGERTIHLILGLLPSGRCTAEIVASYIGIDRRTRVGATPADQPDPLGTRRA